MGFEGHSGCLHVKDVSLFPTGKTDQNNLFLGVPKLSCEKRCVFQPAETRGRCLTGNGEPFALPEPLSLYCVPLSTSSGNTSGFSSLRKDHSFKKQ